MLKSVYLCYPIDQASGGAAKMQSLYREIEYFKAYLTENHLAGWVFDPGDAFSVSTEAEISDGLPRINRAALYNADVVVAFLPADVPSVGVPMEIDRACAAGKRVVVVSDAKAWMLARPGIDILTADFSPENLREIAQWIHEVETREDANARYVDLPIALGPNGKMPTRTYPTDAGFDLYVSKTTTILPGQFMDVPADIKVELPENTWLWVTGRSSALRTHGLLIHTGIIDPGYRGDIFAGAFNLRLAPVVISKGDRIAQMIPMYNNGLGFVPVQVSAVSPSPRGEKGFGSSGN